MLCGSVAQAQDAFVPDDFPTIQAAVFGATDGDASGTVDILVRAGIYVENVLIFRSNLVLQGENPATTSVVSAGVGNTITVQDATNVTITGFSISGDQTRNGVELRRTNASLVQGNVFSGNRRGIDLNDADDNEVSTNTFMDNVHGGIKVRGTGNLVSDNDFLRGGFGVAVVGFSGNTVQDNRISDTGSVGIGVVRSSGNVVQRNVVLRAVDTGIRLHRTSANMILSNMSRNNTQNGFRTRRTADELVSGNAFTGNTEWGIRRRDFVNDDYSADAGIQVPTGDNDCSGNVLGPLRED
jgi:parallel beta-helix repeat protein